MTDEQIKELDHLNAVLVEHLDQFVVLGYTMDGKRVRWRSWTTHQQEDALQQQLKDELREAEEESMMYIGEEDED